ncbi:hypothetical protein [Phaeovulum sp.]|uniref:hypothetical protein n=1 Tax=Phaeovulum sp. TaxID=2934796 RepID=UPI0035694662
MVDHNLQNFYTRLERIERINLAGGAFEAVGTLGRSAYAALRPRRRRRMVWLRPLAIILLSFLVIKGGLHAQLGADTYNQRLNLLRAGTPVEQVGAWVLGADALTLMVSAQLRPYLR